MYKKNILQTKIITAGVGGISHFLWEKKGHNVFLWKEANAARISASSKLTHTVVVKEWEGTVRVSVGTRRYVCVEAGGLWKNFCLSEYLWGMSSTGKGSLGPAGMIGDSPGQVIVS